MSEAHSLVDMYSKWTQTPAIAEFVQRLRMQYPDAADLDLANHALHFSQAHMMAYLVSALDSAGEKTDPDRPPWL